MQRTGLTTRYWLATLALGTLICAAPAGAQSQVATTQGRDSDLTRQQVGAFDQFLDSHSEISEQLRSNPSLINNEDFVENHPQLKTYLKDHPELREEIRENPNAFMSAERGYDRREDVRVMSNMDQFLDRHPEIAEQLQKNPALVNNKDFVEDHPPLKQFLSDHPDLRQQYQANPNAFMHQEQRFDRLEDSRQRMDSDLTRGELANMDHFLDKHPEIAEQLHKNPSLINNKEFVENHPALQQFLATHPETREEYRENPNGFMHQEQRFDRREGGGFGRDHDVMTGDLSSFHEFLQGHSNIANELSKNPSLATNEEYLQNHSALQTYLKANPQVHEELKGNPQAFVKSAQSFDAAPSTAISSKGAMKLPTSEPKK